MLTITADQAIESLREVVAQRGRDYVYKGELRQQIIDSIINDTPHPIGEYRQPNLGLRKAILNAGPGDVYTYLGKDPQERLRTYAERDAQNVSCTYAEGDSYDPTPSCGVGLAVSIIDRDSFLTMADVERSEGGYSPYEFEINGVAHLDDGATHIYSMFQEQQDSGKTYGEALDAAEAEYNKAVQAR